MFFSTPNQRQLVKLLVFASISAVAIGMQIVFESKLEKWNYYRHSSLVYDNRFEQEINRYAVKEATGKYLFAASTPKNLALGISFSQSSNLRIFVEPGSKKNCSKDGLGKTKLTIRTETTFVSTLFNTDTFNPEISVRVLPGDRASISLVNNIEPDCGQAVIRVKVFNWCYLYPPLFFVFWCALLFIFSRHELHFLALGGATINLAFVASELLVATPTLLSLGLSSIASAAAVGVLGIVSVLWLPKILRIIFGFVISVIILFLPVINIGNYFAFGVPLDTDTIHALLQTNPSEVLQFWESSFDWKYSVAIFTIFLIIGGALLYSVKNVRDRSGVFSVSILLVLIPTMFINEAAEHISLIRGAKQSVEIYFQEMRAYKKLVELRKHKSTDINVSSPSPSKITIVVIGESANRNHLSAYGYPRETTPFIDGLIQNGSVIRFDKAFSNHTHTNPVLEMALTSANQYNSEKWYKSVSLLDLASYAGAQTIWISNQKMLGAWDNSTALLAKEADTVVALNKKVGKYKQPGKYDISIVEKLEKSLRKIKSSGLVFVHLMGSHATYCRRFPDKFEIFVGPIEKRYFGSAANSQLADKLNCYDNSIYYSDYVLSKIVDVLSKQSIPASLLYFSDHADEVIGGKAHNSANFDYEMTEIPLLFWANNLWKKSFDSKWKNLINNRNKIFTNDHIFETVAGMADLHSKVVDMSNDLSSEHYREVEQPKTLHGRVNLEDEKNWRYWQVVNTESLQQLDNPSLLLPHRVNTIGKASQVLSSGLSGMEVDVVIEESEKDLVFSVGHGVGVMAGISLEEYLSSVNFMKVEKLWLDAKNINNQNVMASLKRIQKLDAMFNIKHRLIFETGAVMPEVKRFSNAGYHVSYYLPTKEIDKAKELGHESSLKLAEKLASNTETMGVNAISFNLRDYSWTKEYLEPLVIDNIGSYHAWFPPGLSFSTKNLLFRLSETSFFNDDRIKTILLGFKSQYSL